MDVLPGPDGVAAVPATDTQVASHVRAARPHTLVLLFAGPNRDQPDDEADRLQAAHLRHLVGLWQHGHLVVNGPLTDDSELRGVSIYASADLDLVSGWVQADPAVVAGRLRAELHPWFGLLPGDAGDEPSGDGPVVT
jgi:uncharacterized protein YciI